MDNLKISEGKFTIDGEEITIISGAIHYFRVVPEYWEDRLLKLKACGFNTLETYVPWNLHEPEPGKFCFDGRCDLVEFIELAEKIGLHVIVRPSPYICSEWDLGGLPAWLLKDENMKLRCFYKPFLDKIDKYYDVLLPKIKPLLSTNGGPVIAVQIENEYGSYGNDKKYLQYLKNALNKRGIDVPLFTSDGPTDSMLQGGTLPDIYKTVNFGSRPEESFKKLKEYQPDKPVMCMEFWNGWFDHWGEDHHTREGEDVAKVLDNMLKLGGSVNFYMFHGGTNYGFHNGANFDEVYQPTITSYDSDAPVSESGNLTEKYYKVRDVLSKYVEVDKDLLPDPIVKKGYGKVEMTETANLLESLIDLTDPVEKTCPQPMEKLGQNYGFILYRTKVSGPRSQEQNLFLQDVHDRALIFIDGEYKGTVYRNDDNSKISLLIDKNEVTLDILVENMGRINYGPKLKDYKGITEGVRLNNQFLFNWTIYPLPMKDFSSIKFNQIEKSNLKENQPTFYKGKFQKEEKADTFVNIEGWKKGVVFINGFNLGRYWEVGPQKTLYLPAPLLKEGENEIVVFELHGTEE
ncbi:MAG: glycoside hydrolase family 35 protein, partial [Halanaerobiaceae bacterium]